MATFYRILESITTPMADGTNRFLAPAESPM